jgi:uncharacterized protein (TIGR03790 family)
MPWSLLSAPAASVGPLSSLRHPQVAHLIGAIAGFWRFPADTPGRVRIQHNNGARTRPALQKCNRLNAIAAVVLFLGLGTVHIYAQDRNAVLVVANSASASSVSIAMQYAAARGVPDDQVLRITTATRAQVTRAAFEREIQAPIAGWLASRGAQDRILYIVLTHDVPLRIDGTRGRQGTGASVDSELALLYRRMAGATERVQGPVANPYFFADTGDLAKPFDRAAHDIYLVTRLDGFTTADALALIDRGAAPVRDGRILLDQPDKATDVRADWFKTAADRLALGEFRDRIVHETTARALVNETGILGYYSWGSNDPALSMRHPGLSFVPGALAGTFVSTDARTVAAPPEVWKPSRPGMRNDYAGSSQSLAADLVRDGATGVSGQVAEPYLDGAVRPDILFPGYVSGLNLAEAFYRAIPYLSWQTVVFGDPLCAPFRTPATTISTAPAMDPETEMPAIFSQRRLANMRVPGVADAVLKLMMRAEARSARLDMDGAIEVLQRATVAGETFIPAWRALAAVFEQVRKYPEANQVYRRILTLDPDDLPALNNLAFNVAVYQNQPKDALPLAARAARLAKRDPLIDDTLGWIHHLLGDDQQALRLLEPARRALPTSAILQFHAAQVFRAVGRLDEARKALDAAGQLDPSLRETTEFRALEGDAEAFSR